MRTEKDVHTPSATKNKVTKKMQLPHEVYNSVYNHATIIQAINDGRARDIHYEPKVRKGTAAFVIGSGGSLDDLLPLFKDWEGGIFCSTSHALTLIHHGCEPTHILGLDPFACYRQIKGVDWSKTRTKLVTQPGVWPTLIREWPNEMLLFRQFLGNHQTFYAAEQRTMYSDRRTIGGEDFEQSSMRASEFRPLIPTEFTAFACTPPAELFAADILGYKTIFLSGCDFGYVNGKGRHTRWKVEDDGSWTEHKSPWKLPPQEKIDEAITRDVEDWHDAANLFQAENGVWMSTQHAYYKKNLMTAIRLNNANVYSTDHGTMGELAYADGKEVIEYQGDPRRWGRQSKAGIAKRIEPYLASVGCYVINGPAGYTFVETENPRTDIPRFIIGLLRSYICDSCGNNGVSPDDTEHEGDNCKICAHGVMHRINKVNLKANMHRIDKLIGKKEPGKLLQRPGMEGPSITKYGSMIEKEYRVDDPNITARPDAAHESEYKNVGVAPRRRGEKKRRRGT